MDGSLIQFLQILRVEAVGRVFVSSALGPAPGMSERRVERNTQNGAQRRQPVSQHIARGANLLFYSVETIINITACGITRTKLAIDLFAG
jgi:hypothetical protein